MVKKYYVHRLVASKFVANPYGLPRVNHKDGNTANNKATNLEWVDARQNYYHAKGYEDYMTKPAYDKANYNRWYWRNKSKHNKALSHMLDNLGLS
ncbi:HNH endonuclease [Escherichia coli]|uniref:HNH endonuclease n=1 Tax=Escherichia coli TaxID=562 RepID=UPI003F66A81A